MDPSVQIEPPKLSFNPDASPVAGDAHGRLYRFRYFDPLRNRWTLARYVCEAPAIRCRYPDYVLIGAPEVRRVPDDPLALSAAHLARGANEFEIEAPTSIKRA
jgi:hypothetical protein